MQRLREQASEGLRLLDQLADGQRTGTRPALTPRSAITRLQPLPAPQRAQMRTMHHSSSGSPAVALVWCLWLLLSAIMISQGGGGGWIAALCLGLLGSLRQASNQLDISNYHITLRDGMAGHRCRQIPHQQLAAVWVIRPLFGRWFNFGRLGLQLQDGEVVWSPVIHAPYLAKQALIAAVSGQHNPFLARQKDLRLGPRPAHGDPISDDSLPHAL